MRCKIGAAIIYLYHFRSPNIRLSRLQFSTHNPPKLHKNLIVTSVEGRMSAEPEPQQWKTALLIMNVQASGCVLLPI
jgi:hypothetical protein